MNLQKTFRCEVQRRFEYNRAMFDENGSSSPLTPVSGQAAVDAPAPSQAVLKFRSCRWRRGGDENGGVECCSHRDVLPMAGTTGFDPEAWCPDCNFFKLRRTPKKRTPDDYRY